MKKTFILCLMAMIAASCEVQEQDSLLTEEPQFEVTTLTASVSNEFATKTNFQIDGDVARFRWDDNDQIDVAVSIGNSKYTGVHFVSTDPGDVNVEFKDSQVSKEATYASVRAEFPLAAISDWAFYPSRNNPDALSGGYELEWDIRPNYYDSDKAKYTEDEIITVTIPSQITAPALNPMSVVPLMGKKGEGDSFHFSPITGVFGITLNNLTAEVDYLTISSESAWLSGSFKVNRPDGNPAYIDQESVVSGNHSITFKIPAIEGTGTFYVPIPAGTIPAGLTIKAGCSSDKETEMVVTTKKAFTITTGVISSAPALSFKYSEPKWEDYATGTFVDDFLWGYNTGLSSVSSVPVTIQRSGSNPNKYRFNNPYTVACAAASYTPYTEGVVADEWFTFVVAEDGSVTYPAFRSGVEDKVSGGYPLKLNQTGTCAVEEYYDNGEIYKIKLGSLYTKYEDSSYKYTKPDVLHLTFDIADETWTKVADGTFIDEKIWGLQGWGSTTVDIELYQSDYTGTRFRVPNPYLVAKDSFSYSTYTEGDDIVGDEYLSFYISDNDAVVFTTFKAGIEDKPSGGNAMKVWYPIDFGSSYTTAQAGNLVASYRSDGLPAEVELYPIYTAVSNVGYKYTDLKTSRVRMSFPLEEEETWTAVSVLQFKDEFIFNDRHGKGENQWHEVTLERSDLNPGRYRIANPYPAMCDELGVTKYETAPSDYLVMTVAADSTVTYDEFRPGVGDTSRELLICEPSDYNAQYGASKVEGSSRVMTFDESGIPSNIRLYAVYYGVGNSGYFYTRDSGADVIVMTSSADDYPWVSIGEGLYKDKQVWECAGLTDYAVREFQQHSTSPKKFRVRKPYPGEESGDWFVFDVTNPARVTSDNYYVDYEVTAAGKASFKPWIRNGIDYGYNYSDVLLWQDNGLPSVVEIGPCYRATSFTSYDYEIGRDHEHLAIEIVFPGCETYNTQQVGACTCTHYQSGLKAAFHNPAISMLFPTGTLTKMVVKISGIDMSLVSGLRLWDDYYGWLEDAYVAPDENGIVTITQFKNTVTSGYHLDLNFWITEAPVGTAVHFDVQEVVMTVNDVSYSLYVDQDKEIGHYTGIVVNNGGDVINVRGAEETCASFRIPALVTSNAGTLIAAYDVRYRHSGDLVADIDVGVKRSTDGGSTWSDLILAMDMGIWGYEDEVAAGTMTREDAELNNGIGDPCLLVDENTGRIFCFGLWTHGHSGDADKRSLAWGQPGYDIDNTPQFMMVYSDDDGVTWSEPINVTQQIKKYDARMCFQGPGRGITMKDGTLVIPIQSQLGESKNMHGLYPLNSGIAYSTDHGLTWHSHEFAHPITSECTVAEIEPGVLLLSMRDETDSHYRRNYITRDLGRSWTPHVTNGTWLDSTCEASLIHVDADKNVTGKDFILFSNPHNTSRSRMTIHYSLDQGVNWNNMVMIDSGGSLGYSCLTMIGEDKVGILYESSKGSIYFQSFHLTEIVK